MGKVVLLAGGGGHTAYAYALAQHLSGKCEMEMVVPQGDKLSYDRLKKFGDVRILSKPRGPKTPMTAFLAGLAKSFFQSSSIVRGKSVMVSTGSNFCLVPSFLAWINGIPTINMESSVRFTRAAKTVKILAKFASVTALQWEEQKKLLPNGVVFGPMLTKPEIKPYKGGYILVTGGTFGHKLLFQTLDSSNIENVVLQAGALYTPQYSQKHPSWKVIDYSDRFHELIAGADVVVTHFGETIIDSALVYGKPTVISVNPEWTRTIGLEDATMLARKVNGVLLNGFTPEALCQAIDTAMKQRPPQLDNGAESLGKFILELVEK
ncbi:MAG: UDP-N-acetylglucosamine--N-acetylmuramyl-(pentapeptide) pyrophosphoryl-undecaprenol N-acetylglucosamine transferase [Nitrosopumilaceae archaeon]